MRSTATMTARRNRRTGIRLRSVATTHVRGARTVTAPVRGVEVAFRTMGLAVFG